MMRYIKLLLLVICVPIFVSASHNTNSEASSSYDIANIYEKVELKDGSKSLDSYGNVKYAKAVFVPTKIDTGKGYRSIG